MLCQQCKKNPATVSYVEVVNGERFECHFCAACYADLYGKITKKMNNEILAGLFGSSVMNKPFKNEKVCPVCGTSYSDYERSGLLGCTSCYDVFKAELIPSILRMQGKSEHVGKAEKNTDALGLHRQLKALQEQLEDALRCKRFGEAGRLNRKIDSIKKILFGGGNG